MPIPFADLKASVDDAVNIGELSPKARAAEAERRSLADPTERLRRANLTEVQRSIENQCRLDPKYVIDSVGRAHPPLSQAAIDIGVKELAEQYAAEDAAEEEAERLAETAKREAEALDRQAKGLAPKENPKPKELVFIKPTAYSAVLADFDKAYVSRPFMATLPIMREELRPDRNSTDTVAPTPTRIQLGYIFGKLFFDAQTAFEFLGSRLTLSYIFEMLATTQRTDGAFGRFHISEDIRETVIYINREQMSKIVARFDLIPHEIPRDWDYILGNYIAARADTYKTMDALTEFFTNTYEAKWSELMRRFQQIPSNVLREALDTMVKEGQLTLNQYKPLRGAPGETYVRAIGFGK